MKEIMDYFPTIIGELRIECALGKGKSGYSYLAYHDRQPRVLKVMHNEPCPYYQFNDNKTRLEVDAYHRLKQIDIPLPHLIAYDLERQYLIKEFIDGPTAAEWLAKGNHDDAVISQLFRLSRKLRRAHLNIDYFPTNFVLSRGKLVYIDYELNLYDPKWGLENWGLYYWANAAGMARYLRSGDAAAINLPPDSGEPLREPFRAQVEKWIEAYGK